MSNCGRWCDYPEAYITLPTVVVISGLDASGNYLNWTDAELKDTDHLLALKNSHLNLINSSQIDYDNQKTVQATDHINDYLIFKQHTEMSEQKLHGPTIGYNKDTAKSWYYHDVNGISNNHCSPHSYSNTRISEANEGIFNRCKNAYSLDDNLRKTHSIFGDSISSNIKQSNRSYIVNATTHKAFYYNVIIRLKDLPLFKNFPTLLKGGNFKINLVLNQCEFQFSTGNTLGNMSFLQNTFNGKMTNPVMVSSDSVKYRGVDYDTAVSGDAYFSSVQPYYP